MPTIGIRKKLLDKHLNHVYDEEEFADLCFKYGLELDDVTSEKTQLIKEQGAEKAGGASEELVYKVELPANRYDLLCVEGLCRALNVFLQKENVPTYKLVRPKGKLERLTIHPNTKQVRPHAVAAILRNVCFDADSYASFIDLQDKLHQNLCRKRSLVAIGTHDYDTVKGPFLYTALPPKEIVFQPLNETKPYNASELMELYSEGHLRHYLHIIKDKPVYPVIYDANKVVLSMPPIINGEHSKIKLSTKNIFIECTATDLTKAKLVLDTIVTLFSQYCSEAFSIEPVEVEQSDKTIVEYPVLSSRNETVGVDYINSQVGINLSAEKMADLLTRMCLSASVDADKKSITVVVPPTRQDIIHACDIVEDVAIAFGYNEIVECLPGGATIAKQFPLNKLTDALRQEMAAAMFTEALTFSLCSRDEISTKIRHEDGVTPAVHIGNPKTLEFQVGRTCLLPGILKTLSYNKDMPLPLRLFEIQDVLLKDTTKDVGAKNERRLCAVYYGKTSGFELIHGVLDRVMQLLRVPFAKDGSGYFVQAVEDSAYLKGLAASVICYGKEIGRLGVIHPEVIHNFELTMPASALEINIEGFL